MGMLRSSASKYDILFLHSSIKKPPEYSPRVFLALLGSAWVRLGTPLTNISMTYLIVKINDINRTFAKTHTVLHNKRSKYIKNPPEFFSEGLLSSTWVRLGTLLTTISIAYFIVKINDINRTFYPNRSTFNRSSAFERNRSMWRSV